MDELNKRIDRCCESIKACLEEGSRSGQQNPRRHDRSNSSTITSQVTYDRYPAESGTDSPAQQGTTGNVTSSLERMGPGGREESWRTPALRNMEDQWTTGQDQRPSSSGLSSLPSSETSTSRTRDESDTSLLHGNDSAISSLPESQDGKAGMYRSASRPITTSAYAESPAVGQRARSVYSKPEASWVTSSQAKELGSQILKSHSILSGNVSALQLCTPDKTFLTSSKSAGTETRSSAYRGNIDGDFLSPGRSARPEAASMTQWKSSLDITEKERVASWRAPGDGRPSAHAYTSVENTLSPTKFPRADGGASALKNSGYENTDKERLSPSRTAGSEEKSSLHRYTGFEEHLSPSNSVSVEGRPSLRLYGDYSSGQKEVISPSKRGAVGGRFMFRSSGNDSIEELLSSSMAAEAEPRSSVFYSSSVVKEPFSPTKSAGMEAKPSLHGMMDLERFEAEVLSASLSTRKEGRPSMYQVGDLERFEKDVLSASKALGPETKYSLNHATGCDSLEESRSPSKCNGPEAKSLAKQSIDLDHIEVELRPTSKAEGTESRSSMYPSSGYESLDRDSSSPSKSASKAPRSTVHGNIAFDRFNAEKLSPSKSAGADGRPSLHRKSSYDSLGTRPKTYSLAEKSAPIESLEDLSKKTFSQSPEEKISPSRARLGSSVYKPAQMDSRTSTSRLGFPDTQPTHAEGPGSGYVVRRPGDRYGFSDRNACPGASVSSTLSITDSLRSHGRTHSTPAFVATGDLASPLRQDRLRAEWMAAKEAVLSGEAKGKTLEEFLFRLKIEREMADAVAEMRSKSRSRATTQQREDSSLSEFHGHKRSSTVPLEGAALHKQDMDVEDPAALKSPSASSHSSRCQRAPETLHAFSQRPASPSHISLSQRPTDPLHASLYAKTGETPHGAVFGKPDRTSHGAMFGKSADASLGVPSRNPVENFHGTSFGKTEEMSHNALLGKSGDGSRNVAFGKSGEATNMTLFGKSADAPGATFFAKAADTPHLLSSEKGVETSFSHPEPSADILELLERRRKAIEKEINQRREANSPSPHASPTAPDCKGARSLPQLGDAAVAASLKSNRHRSKSPNIRTSPPPRDREDTSIQATSRKTTNTRNYSSKSPPWNRNPAPYLFPYGTYIKDGKPVFPTEGKVEDREGLHPIRRNRTSGVRSSLRRFFSFFKT